MGDLSVPGSRRMAVLVYALERWETLVIVIVSAAGIAVSILVLEGSLLAIGIWIVFGLAGVGGMVLVSFRDAESVDDALIARVDLTELRDQHLRDQVARARDYQRAIWKSVREVRSPTLRASLETITREMDDPIKLVFTLARRLDAHQRDSLLQNDLSRLQHAARAGRLSPAEADQLATLGRLQDLMNDTAAAIDAALARLGSSYSEIQLARSTGDLKSGATTRVLDDLHQQSAQLRDLNSSLDEVYARRS